MGRLSALLGHAAQADVEDVERDLERLLADDEKVERAFKLLPDLLMVWRSGPAAFLDISSPWEFVRSSQ